MPRSPLLRSLLRLQRAVRTARLTGQAPLQALEGQRAHRLSRRTLLEASGALSAGWLASGCSDSTSEVPKRDAEVVIVGGGMAGLHAAYRLKKAGVRAVVYDAQKRLGGRMFTDRKTFPGGQHCELGGELIDTGHETMRDLARELDIALFDYNDDDANLAHVLGYFDGKLLTEADILEGYVPIAAAIDDALGVLVDPDGYITYHDPNGAEGLDQQSLSSWLDSVGASGPVRKLLEVAYVIEYGLEPDVTNIINLLWLISTDTAQFRAFGDSDERFHAKGGNDAYIARLADALDEDQLVRESRLLAVKQISDGRYRLTFDQGKRSRDVTADHVVLALPFTLLRDVELDLDMPRVKRRAIDELGYGNNTKLMCGFSSRLWREAGSNGETFSDLAYQATWDTSRLQPGASGILTNYTGGDRAVRSTEGSSAAQQDTFLGELEQVFPGATQASNGKVARFSWPTHEFTRGSYSAYKVGQYTTIAGAEIERINNVHFCGEHTSLDAQGYMEGAALTGAMAAVEVAEDLGIELERRAAGASARRITSRALLAREARVTQGSGKRRRG